MLETGKTVYVDDGFTGHGYVHWSPPMGGIYLTPFPLTAELDRKNCDVPPVFDSDGSMLEPPKEPNPPKYPYEFPPHKPFTHW
jgi:hypothetical protein